MKKIAIYLFALLILSCNNNDNEIDCSAVTCATPGYFIKIVDNETGSNFIEDNNINSDQINITNADDEAKEFEIISSDSESYNNTIYVSLLQTEQQFLNIENLSEISLGIELTITNQQACCANVDYSVSNISSEYSFEFDSNTKILLLKI